MGLKLFIRGNDIKGIKKEEYKDRSCVVKWKENLYVMLGLFMN